LNVRADQSSLAGFVKGFPDIAGIAARLAAILTAPFENRRLTASLLAESLRVWPVSAANRLIAGE
jgi:hypothetical protein